MGRFDALKQIQAHLATFEEALANLAPAFESMAAMTEASTDEIAAKVHAAAESVIQARHAYHGTIRGMREARRVVEEEADRLIRLDAWRRLSARTAHRLDNQLFAARGALRVLKGQVRPEASEGLGDVDACLTRLARISKEFRRFSTDEQPTARPTNVRMLLEEAVRRYAKSAQSVEVVEAIPLLLPECLWDPQQIDQGVTELLENAIRHTPPGGTVRVEAESVEKAGKQHVMIRICNDGEGVRREHKARLFEPFFSLRPGGTGLGLAIVKQIIDNHKGSIRETGEPGKFARFEIELPTRPFEEDTDEGPGD